MSFSFGKKTSEKKQLKETHWLSAYAGSNPVPRIKPFRKRLKPKLSQERSPCKNKEPAPRKKTSGSRKGKPRNKKSLKTRNENNKQNKDREKNAEERKS